MIACEVFRDELQQFQPQIPIHYLEMGLHDQPMLLRQQLQSMIESMENAGKPRILLAYGNCGHAILGLTTTCSELIIPRIDDCVSLFLEGNETRKQWLLKFPGNYYYSAGWIRGGKVPGPDRELQLRNALNEKYPDSPDSVEVLLELDAEMFSVHNTVCYLKTTENPELEHYCQSCAAHLGWNYTEHLASTRLLEQLLNGTTGSELFMNIPPGHRISMNAEGVLFPEPI